MYFIYPYAEVAGQPVEGIRKSFRFLTLGPHIEP